MQSLNKLIAAAAFTIFASPIGASPEIIGAREDVDQQVGDLIQVLESWLDQKSPYQGADVPLEQIVFVDNKAVVDYHGQSTQLGASVRGVYDEKLATIFLVRPWQADDRFDQSVLLHELAHHRQTYAKHWYCDQAQEWDAYKLQAAYLEEAEIDPGFNWALIVLESSCANRDIHP